MILISFALALIAIVFGAMLLAQSKKDNLGNLFKYISWFVIVMGFLLLLCNGAHALMRCCMMRHEMMEQRECMMMNRGYDDHCMMGGDCQMMMHCHRGDMCHENSCDGGMMKCEDNKGNCSEGKGSSCTEESMKSGSCPMMKGKADTAKARK